VTDKEKQLKRLCDDNHLLRVATWHIEQIERTPGNGPQSATLRADHAAW